MRKEGRGITLMTREREAKGDRERERWLIKPNIKIDIVVMYLCIEEA